jgi:hypothetical protein
LVNKDFIQQPNDSVQVPFYDKFEDKINLQSVVRDLSGDDAQDKQNIEELQKEEEQFDKQEEPSTSNVSSSSNNIFGVASNDDMFDAGSNNTNSSLNENVNASQSMKGRVITINGIEFQKNSETSPEMSKLKRLSSYIVPSLEILESFGVNKSQLNFDPSEILLDIFNMRSKMNKITKHIQNDNIPKQDFTNTFSKMVKNPLLTQAISLKDILSREYIKEIAKKIKDSSRPLEQRDHDYPSKHGYNLTFEDCNLRNPYESLSKSLNC